MYFKNYRMPETGFISKNYLEGSHLSGCLLNSVMNIFFLIMLFMSFGDVIKYFRSSTL
jgi:hypothetical protein